MRTIIVSSAGSAKHAGKRSLATALTGCLALGAILVFWIAVNVVGPKIESYFWPVFTDYQISGVKILDGNRLVFYPLTKKLRDCEYLEARWFVLDKNGVSHDREITFLNYDRSRVVAKWTRPTGYQSLGAWMINIRPGDVEHWGSVRHNCGMPWVTQRHVGPWKIGD